MKYHKLISVLLIFQITILPSLLFSQSIEWTYEIKENGRTIPQSFWMDEKGEGYFNVSKAHPEGPQKGSSNFVLFLNNNGQYRGTTKLNDCKSSIQLMPFGEKRLLATSTSCYIGKEGKKESRVYNYRGRRLKRGKPFPGEKFASIYTDEGFTFFSLSKSKWPCLNPYISFGNVDKQLNFQYDTISLNPIQQEDFCINTLRAKPVQFSDKSWVIPLRYSQRYHKKTVRNGKQLSFAREIKHGIAICIRDKKVAWQYPAVPNASYVCGVSIYESKVGLLFRRNGSYQYKFVVLDKLGNELRKMTIDIRTSHVKDMLISKDKIIVLGRNALFYYDMNGELIEKFHFGENDITLATRMQLTNDEGLIVTTQKSNGNGFIIKFNLGKKEDVIEEISIAETQKDTENKEEEEVEEPMISYGSIDDEIDENIISASVYPNPTAAILNFEFDTNFNSKKKIVVQIFNINGKLVATQQLTEKQTSIDVQTLLPGTYVYRIVLSDQKKLISGQFIKVN